MIDSYFKCSQNFRTRYRLLCAFNAQSTKSLPWRTICPGEPIPSRLKFFSCTTHLLACTKPVHPSPTSNSCTSTLMHPTRAPILCITSTRAPISCTSTLVHSSRAPNSCITCTRAPILCTTKLVYHSYSCTHLVHHSYSCTLLHHFYSCTHLVHPSRAPFVLVHPTALLVQKFKTR